MALPYIATTTAAQIPDATSGLTQTIVMNYLTDNFEPGSMPIYAYQILSTCVIIFLVCLMFMKGVKGENRFGKDPLGE